MAMAMKVDPLNNAYFGTAQARPGERPDSSRVGGSPSGANYFDFSPFGVNFDQPAEFGDVPNHDQQAVSNWLTSNGYSLMDDGKAVDASRWIQDSNGNVVGDVQRGPGKDNFFRDSLGLIVGGYFGGTALAGAFGGAGAAAGAGGELLSGMDLAADAALGTGNNIITAGAGATGGAGAAGAEVIKDMPGLPTAPPPGAPLPTGGLTVPPLPTIPGLPSLPPTLPNLPGGKPAAPISDLAKWAKDNGTLLKLLLAGAGGLAGAASANSGPAWLQGGPSGNMKAWTGGGGAIQPGVQARVRPPAMRGGAGFANSGAGRYIKR